MIHGWIVRTLAVFVLLIAPQALAAGDFRIELHETRNFTGKKLSKIEAVADLAERVVNSAEFRQKVLNFQTKTVKNRKAVYTKTFVQNLGLTNSKVLARLEAATEDYYRERKYNEPKNNGVADIYVSLYNGRSGVVGYTNKGYRRINMNSYYFNRYSNAYLAGNLIHEWLHKVGFSHDSNATSRRPYSVPYGIGGIVREIAAKMSGEKSMDVDALVASSTEEPLLNCSGH